MELATVIIIALAAGILVLAWLLRLAIRGRRVGEGLRCARCDYLLTGLPETSNRCPECGTEVSPASGLNVRTGGRRRATGWAVVCLLVLVAAIWWEQRQVRAWFVRPAEQKPNWLLTLDLDNPSVNTQQAAMAELMVRNNKGHVSRRQQSKMIDVVLGCQANPKGRRQWAGDDAVEWLLDQRAKGAMDDKQWKQMFDLHPPAYAIRPVISSVEPFRIDQPGPGLTWGCTGSASYSIRDIAVDGQPVKSVSTDIRLSEDLPRLSPGQHELSFVTSARLWGTKWGDGEQWIDHVILKFDYRTDGSSTVERVRDAKAIEAFKASIKPRLRSGKNGQVEVYFEFPRDLPACHKVFLRADGREHEIFMIEGGQYSGIGTDRDNLVAAGTSKADIILRPVPAEASKSPYLMKLVDAEVVWKDFPIQPAK